MTLPRDPFDRRSFDAADVPAPDTTVRPPPTRPMLRCSVCGDPWRRGHVCPPDPVSTSARIASWLGIFLAFLALALVGWYALVVALEGPVALDLPGLDSGLGTTGEAQSPGRVR